MCALIRLGVVGVIVMASATVGRTTQQAESVSAFASPRLAAVAYAIAHGFEIPRANLVVANEVETGQVNDRPRTANDRARSLPVEQTMRDSRAVAKLLGPDVKTGPVTQLVQCPQRRCYGSSTAWALLVDDLKDDSMDVGIALYSPLPAAGAHSTLLQAIVETARVPSGWIAKGFTLAPQKINVR